MGKRNTKRKEKNMGPAQAYLSRVTWLDNRIRDITAERERLLAEIDSIPSGMREDGTAPGGGGYSDRTAALGIKLAGYTESLYKQKKALEALKAEAMDIMRRLEVGKDGNLYYTVLYSVYFEGKKWSDIAEKINYSIRGAQKVHGRALLAFEKLMEVENA